MASHSLKGVVNGSDGRLPRRKLGFEKRQIGSIRQRIADLGWLLSSDYFSDTLLGCRTEDGTGALRDGARRYSNHHASDVRARLFLVERALETAVTLHAHAQAGERIRPVVLNAIGQRIHLVVAHSARREIFPDAVAVPLVGARDNSGVVGSFSDQRVARRDLHLRIVPLPE